ncbi:hypothetical protein ABZ890_39735 [Streptomyces sp. NPDC046984]|uniref:hypothetical protein n=1 Tax=Streptomyces sp. NPDC046984 TaxID=3155138 RepID=UPI0033F7C9A4
MPPGDFWDMTLGQLLTLANEHQAAHQTGGSRDPEPVDGASLLGFAAMRRS